MYAQSTLFNERELRQAIRETWLDSKNWNFIVMLNGQYKEGIRFKLISWSKISKIV